MSRIGKVPVAVPNGVTASIEGSILSVKGPKGVLTMPMLDDISYGIEDGQIVVRPMNYLALSYDHRIIDGREAVLALVAMKEALEDPARLLLEV